MDVGIGEIGAGRKCVGCIVGGTGCRRSVEVGTILA